MLQAGRALYFMTMLGLAVTGYAGTFGMYISDSLEQEVCSRLPAGVIEKKIVPHGALWKKETLRESTPPEGYHTAVGWINVATVFPCHSPDTPALVEIRAMRIIEKVDNTEEVIYTKKFESDERNGFTGALFQRYPFWFGPGEGKSTQAEIFTTKGLVINARQIPESIYHGWTDPRTRIAPGGEQRIELEVRITGNARLQLGLDYWKDFESDYSGYDPTCQTSNNCEAWIGDWQGDTNGQFVTIRSPLRLNQK